VVVLEASCPKRLGGATVVLDAGQIAQGLDVIWVDQGFSGKNFARVIEQLAQARIQVVCRNQPGFHVFPKRWIVEPTFGWWNQYRRLSKDYELLPETSEAMIYGVMIRLMLHRLTKLQTLTS